MASKETPEGESRIELVEQDGEITLYIGSGQAMQAWERDLMAASAELLCSYGSCFLEAGLGLGISALHIARHRNTCRHVVVEKHDRIIELFRERHPTLPPSLEIVHADFFDHLAAVDAQSLDGIFFDPYLPDSLNNDVAFWNRVVPRMVEVLRIGGVLIPCFSSRPVLRWQFEPFFDRVIFERRQFTTYHNTDYMGVSSGSVFIQCFVRCR